MRTPKQILGDKLVTLVELSREIVDLKYGGLPLSEEGEETLVEMEEKYRELKTELETVKRFEEEIDKAEMYITRARSKALIGEIE